MKLKVLSYVKFLDYHVCRCLESKKEVYLDLLVNKSLRGETKRSIVGKTISISHSVPYLEIAYDVVVLAEQVEGEK